MDIFRRTRPLPDASVDALLSGRVVADEPVLQDLVALVRAAADAPGPVPNAALAAVLSDGLVMPPLPAVAPARRWAGRGALVLAVVVASSTGAAAANALPAPLQSAVADAVERLTPLELPRPEDDRPVPVAPVPGTVPEVLEDVVPEPDARQGQLDDDDADDREQPTDGAGSDEGSDEGSAGDEDADDAPEVDGPDEDTAGTSADEQEVDQPDATDADDRSGSSSGMDAETAEVEELEDDAPRSDDDVDRDVDSDDAPDTD